MTVYELHMNVYFLINTLLGIVFANDDKIT